MAQRDWSFALNFLVLIAGASLLVTHLLITDMHWGIFMFFYLYLLWNNIVEIGWWFAFASVGTFIIAYFWVSIIHGSAVTMQFYVNTIFGLKNFTFGEFTLFYVLWIISLGVVTSLIMFYFIPNKTITGGTTNG